MRYVGEASASGTAFACVVSTCREIATIVVTCGDSTERPLCGEHWMRAQEAAGHQLAAGRTLARSLCFVAECRAGAVEIMVHVDSSLLPCCEGHLNDLSWVTPEKFARAGRS